MFLRKLRKCGWLSTLCIAALMVGISPIPALAKECIATRGEPAGDANITEAPIRSKVGEGFVLSGLVRDVTTCLPVEGARITFWWADERGNYDEAHRATIITGEDGLYQLETNRPGGYGPEPHIHMVVRAAGFDRLVSTFVLTETDVESGVYNLTLVPAVSQVLHYHGDIRRTGVYATAARDARQPKRMKWAQMVGLSAHSGPLAIDGMVYVPTARGQLHALNADTGRAYWVFDTEHEVLSSPAYADGVIYIGGDGENEGWLYALNARTGKTEWAISAPDTVYTAPLVHNGTVYFGSADGTFLAVDIAKRAIKWRVDTGQFLLWSPAIMDDTVYLVGGVTAYAINPENGEIVWQTEIGDPEAGAFWTPFALANGALYAGNGDGSVYALDSKTGEVVWQFTPAEGIGEQPEYGAGWSGTAVADGIVYIGSKNLHFYALDAFTGAELWKFQVEDWAVTDPVVAGGAVIFGVGNHDNREGPRTLYALDAKTGEELWTFQARGRLLTAAAVADERVFVASTSGQVYALE